MRPASRQVEYRRRGDGLTRRAATVSRRCTRAVAAYDEKLVSRFHPLGDPDTGILCTPPVFIAFDVLQRGNRDLRRLPLSDRRTVLEDLVERRHGAAVPAPAG